jgi:mRNA interferase HigB
MIMAALFPIWEHAVGHENYRVERAVFVRSIAFVKFIGTHPEYDRVDALTISLF